MNFNRFKPEITWLYSLWGLLRIRVGTCKEDIQTLWDSVLLSEVYERATA